jgi:hypothetical protein
LFIQWCGALKRVGLALRLADQEERSRLLALLSCAPDVVAQAEADLAAGDVPTLAEALGRQARQLRLLIDREL